MPREKKHGTTLEECELAGGSRLPKSKRVGLNRLVEDFLGAVMVEPEKKTSQAQQRENAAEIRGFYKAQERLRELIAMGGTDAIAELAEVRDDRQQRPVMIGNFRIWMGLCPNPRST